MSYKFTGSKYNDQLGIKDIAKLVRKELKEKYPKCKFSVRIQRYSGGQSMNVALAEADFNPFATPNRRLLKPINFRYFTEQECLDAWDKTIKEGYHDINSFYIDDDYKLNEKGKQLAKDMKEAVNQYNFDDSDSMTDYFHVNFYYDIAFGKWDKPLIINP